MVNFEMMLKFLYISRANSVGIFSSTILTSTNVSNFTGIFQIIIPINSLNLMKFGEL